MAISKIMTVKECHTDYASKHLKQSIDYISNPEKTDKGMLIGAHNCQPASAYEQMMWTKEHFGKTDKRQGYHLIISFEKGEVDEKTAFGIIGRFAEEYFGAAYEAVYSVHNNTDLIHGHIIFNSVSCDDGRKFRYEKGDWAKTIQPLVNRLCREHGLSTIDVNRQAGKKSKEIEIAGNTNGLSIWKKMICRDIDASVMLSADYEQFLSKLSEKGYSVKTGKYLAVKSPGMERFRRTKTLGYGYTEEQIRERIVKESIKDYEAGRYRPPKIIGCRFLRKCRRKKLTRLQKRYLYKLYHLGLIKKRPYSQAYKYREDIKKMKKLQEQTLFLIRHNISTEVQIHALADKIKTEKVKLLSQKRQLYRQRERFSDVFCLLEKAEEVYEAANEYQNGNSLYKNEYEGYQKILLEMKAHGYTADELFSVRKRINDDFHAIKEKEKLINKELQVADDLIAGNSEMSPEKIEEQIKRKEERLPEQADKKRGGQHGGR